MPNLALNQVQAGSLTVAKAWGSWTGTNTSGVLLNQFGAEPNTARAVNIYRSDWQGNQLLYPTARTNELEYSNDLTNAVWVPQAFNGPVVPTVTAEPTIAAPDGSLGCTLLGFPGVTSGSTQVSRIYQEMPIISSGIAVIPYLWMRTDTGTATVFYGCDSATVGQTDTFAPANLTTSWQRFAAPFTMDVSSGNLRFLISQYGLFAGTYTAFNVYAAFASLELGNVAGSYIPTTSAPVTLTDYTMSGTTVNLAQAPASTAVTTATFYGT